MAWRTALSWQGDRLRVPGDLFQLSLVNIYAYHKKKFQCTALLLNASAERSARTIIIQIHPFHYSIHYLQRKCSYMIHSE